MQIARYFTINFRKVNTKIVQNNLYLNETYLQFKKKLWMATVSETNIKKVVTLGKNVYNNILIINFK